MSALGQKLTCAVQLGISAKCHKRTLLAIQSSRLREPVVQEAR